MEKPWDGVGVGALKRGVGKCKSRGVDLHKKKKKNASGRKVFCVVAFRQSKTFASPMNTGAIQ